MLKYVNYDITFSEIPDEISLCINISNCPCHCKGCHSSYLAEDIGKLLTQRKLKELIESNKGISCVCFMGGDSEPSYINTLAKQVKETTDLKVGWYSGRELISPDVDIKWFDYIKVGPYIEEKGGLDKETTNQNMLKVCNSDNNYTLENITYKFWKE